MTHFSTGILLSPTALPMGSQFFGSFSGEQHWGLSSSGKKHPKHPRDTPKTVWLGPFWGVNSTV